MNAIKNKSIFHGGHHLKYYKINELYMYFVRVALYESPSQCFLEQDRSAGFLVVEQPIIFHEGCISYIKGAVVGASGFTFYTELHDTTQALNNKLEMFLILEHFKLPQQYFLGQQNEETLRSLTKDDVDSFWDGFPIIASHCAFKLYSKAAVTR